MISHFVLQFSKKYGYKGKCFISVFSLVNQDQKGLVECLAFF